MDPNIVSGKNFGILWQAQSSDPKEEFYAKPLVYTVNGVETVITASTMNNVRVFNARTGALITSRQLNPPFLQADIGCNDIANYIGVVGTPIIDTNTNIIYMMAKGYKGGAASGGMPNGIYQLYALQLPGLANAPGFPVLIDGHNADNDKARYFVGGTVLQRPSLATVNGMIIAGFGGVSDIQLGG
jgi:iron transport multicopper oxidase